MAKVEGSVIGDLVGTLSGVTFGKARTARGKAVTARKYASPSNPNTAAQSLQRNKFGDAVQIVRNLGPGFYQDDWNRAVQQLPGFQSLVGIMTDNLDASLDLGVPSDVPLGTLHQPDTISIAQGGNPGEILFSWSAELGDNGANDDAVICFAIRHEPDTDDDHPAFILSPEDARNGTSATIDVGENSIPYVCGIYLRSDLSEPANLCICTFAEADSGAT